MRVATNYSSNNKVTFDGGSNRQYPKVREILSPEYQDLSAEEIDGLFYEMFGDALTAEDIESFWKKIGKGLSRVGKAVAPVAAKIAPIAGAAIGTAIAPGVGTAIGGALGSVAGKALGSVSQSRPRRTRSAQRSSRTRSRKINRSKNKRVQASPAAARLARLLANPKVQQSLLALLMGSAGRQSVRIAGESVPVGAIASTLEVLAREVAQENTILQPLGGEVTSSYLLDEYGEFLVDPASQEERAALVYELIEEDSTLTEEAEDYTGTAPMQRGQRQYLREKLIRYYQELDAEDAYIADDEEDEYELIP